jgi:PAS domain S-box-containing protein
VCLINVIPAVGFLYGIDEFYALPRANISSLTVVALIALGIGLVLARGDGGPMAMLLSKDAGGILLRRLLPLAILAPLILGFLKVQGQRRGLFETEFGTGLLVVVIALLFSAGLWPLARHLSRLAEEEAKAQRAVLTSEERLRLFIEYAPAALAMFDRHMRYLYVSNRWLKDYNLGSRDLRGISHYDVFPKISAALKGAHRRGLAGETLASEGDRFQRADGSVQWVRWEIRPWHDAAGEVGGIVIFTEDITERTLAQERIAHLSSFPELNPNPIFETNLEGKITYLNPAALRQFPELAEAGARYPLLKDWAKARALLQATGKSSTEREVEVAGRVFQQTIHYAPEVGVIRAYLADVTERKRTELAALQLAAIVESADEAIIGKALGGTITSWNRGAQQLYGYTAPEVLGRPISILAPSGQADEMPHLLERLGKGETIAHYESLRQRKDGSVIPVLLKISPIQDASGKIVGASSFAHDITERKQAEEELELAKRHAEDAAAQLGTVVENMAERLYVCDSNGHPILTNEAFRRTFHGAGMPKFPRSFAEEMEVFDLAGNPVPSADWPIGRALRGENVRGVELRLRLKRSGEEMINSYNALPVLDSQGKVIMALFTSQDITEHKRAEEALRDSEERWATTLRSIGDAVISTDAAGNIVFLNTVAEKLTGWPSAEASGKHLNTVFNIIQEITRIRPESPVAKVIRLGLVVGLANHTALIRRDGTEIPIEASGAPIFYKEGKVSGVVLVFHDVSEQRKVAAALRTSERLATTGRLAASIAHEIHNPLDSVGNLLYMISKGAKQESTQQFASMASQELARVTQMTRQMLSFQREAAKPTLVRIREVLDSVLALWQRKIDAAGINARTQVDYDGEILALPGELRQVFANLVGNAIEVVDGQRGKIRVHAFSSRDWRRGQAGLRVVVADNGPGIPDEIRGKIFDPFFTTKGEGGTGLGLWVSADIIRKYEATMRLRSSTRPGRSGTCFSVFFPLQKSGD